MSACAAMLYSMTLKIPTTEPARARAGDTVTWLKTLAEYPASAGWTLYYRLINAAGKIDITASASGASHLISVLPATTAGWTAGDYTLIAWVSNGADRVTLEPGRFTILPNLAVASGGYDSRTQARKMLDAIDAALLSLASGERLAVVEAEITGRRMRYDFTGLMKLRNLYASQLQAEENAERARLGLGSRNKLNVRF